MTSKLARRLGRPLRDFLLCLALFAAVSIAGLADSPGTSAGLLGHAAHARVLEYPPAPPAFLLADITGARTAFDPLQEAIALAILAMTLASLTTLNLWFVRHLRRAYAAPRGNRGG